MKHFRILAGVLVVSTILWACGGNSGGGGGGSGDASSPGDGDGGVGRTDSGSADGCVSDCTDEGVRQCSVMGTKLKECRDEGGCLKWVVAEDCASEGKLCDDSQDPPVCVAPPSCDDGILNQDETDVDCGGSCDPCPAGSQCQTGDDCANGVCENGLCLVCSPGTYRCVDNRLEQCQTDGMDWQLVQECDIFSQQGCDAAAGQCHTLPRIGNGPDNPTGTYYQFAFFQSGDTDFRGGFDVDGLGDYLFVNRDGSHVDVYQVTLLDSDQDGKLEPNQHPDNPDNPGPIEERVLTYVQTYDVPVDNRKKNELFITDSTIYFLHGTPDSLRAYDRASGTVTTLTQIPHLGWGGAFQVLGYDEVRNLWFSAVRERHVFSYDPATDVWSWEFSYPNLAGTHNDGLEVVTDPNTGIPYVYISDMTSNFIGQYHEDENGVWTQVNLFQYNQPDEVEVEGMGFGPLNHFWCTGSGALYEIGGGDLAQYTEPFDPTHQ